MTPLLLLLAFVQPSGTISGVVTDATGAPMPGVVVTVTADRARATAVTAADGTWSVAVPAAGATAVVDVAAPGFAVERREVTLPSSPLGITLRPAAIAETVTVSAGPGAPRLALDGSATSLDRATIADAPAMRLDDRLRSVPGFSLFRRTTSAVANPTTQGVTLRGLSASGASRTLVVADDVPLNDPFGAWVYWNRVPVAALQRVDVLRGASGDIHGDDALGGVIRITSRTSQGAEAWLEAGSRGTVRASAYGALTRASWMAGGAVESGRTGGFLVVAPEARGPIDVNATSKGTSATGWLGVGRAGSVHGTARGGYFEEQRGNGTPSQINATITRWFSAAARGFAFGGSWQARGDATAGNYRQTFSAVTAVGGVLRAGERPTSLQWVGSTGGGGSVDWTRQGRRGEGLVSVSGRFAHANLDEASFTVAGVQSAVARTPATQRNTGLIAHARLFVSPRLSVALGARGEWWDVKNPGGLGTVQARFFFQPRAAALLAAAAGQTIRVTWLSGFRTPTINELFRSFRVGSTLTRANGALKPERSWGPEASYTIARRDWTARAIVYATRLDHAIYNRTIAASPTAIVRQRDNARARAIGSELEFEWRIGGTLTATTAWAFNDSTFTVGELAGRRVPQVPRGAGSVGVRATRGVWSASASLRVFGRQFDDDVNQFTLGAGSVTDARAGWRPSRHGEIFGAIENAFDQEIDTGKTPIRTIGAPRQARAGVIVRF